MQCRLCWGEMLRYSVLMLLWSLSSAFPKENQTYVHDCHYEGRQVVLLSDRLQVDGKDILVLDKVNRTWTVIVADGKQDSALLSLVLEDCEELKKELRRIENSAGMSWLQVVLLLLAALFFIGFVILNFMMSKRCGAVGGVLGSIIHYPAHFLKEKREKEPCNFPSDINIPY